MVIVKSYDQVLDELSRLEPGWDGYGPSQPPSPQAIAAARCIWACPHRDGGLQIELHAGGMDVEIEIDPAGKVLSVYSAPAKLEAQCAPAMPFMSGIDRSAS